MTYTIIDEGRRLQITGITSGDVIYIPKSKASVWAIEDTVLIEYYYNEKSRPIDRQIWSALYTEVSNPATLSAQALKNIINEMITGVTGTVQYTSTATVAGQQDYPFPELVGKTIRQVQLDSGLLPPTQYSYSAPTFTIIPDPDNPSDGSAIRSSQFLNIAYT